MFSIALAQEMGAARFEPENRIFLADALAWAGQVERARQEASLAVARLREIHTPHYMAPAVLSIAARIEPDTDIADRHLAQALAMIEKGGLAHNHVWVHRNGIEIGWLRRDAVLIGHHAQQLERRFAFAPMPLTDLLVQRASVMRGHLQGTRTPAWAAQLQALRKTTGMHGLRLLGQTLDEL